MSILLFSSQFTFGYLNDFRLTAIYIDDMHMVVGLSSLQATVMAVGFEILMVDRLNSRYFDLYCFIV